MRVLTVIVNYRTADLTCKAIRAAVRASAEVPGESRVVVVDNDSRDDSLEILRDAIEREGWSDRVELRASEFNGGFGYGNNFAIRPALEGNHPPDYFYLLNPDAFPAEGALAKLIDYMDANSRVGISGSYIHGVDERPHETAFRFPSVLSEFESAMQLGALSRLLVRHVVPLPIPKQTCQVDWLAGASMLIRRQTLEAVGLFDERFFLYFEETDLCRRARLAGWLTAYVPASRVAHVGSASTGMQDATRRVPGYWFDSRQHYFVKNHGYAYLWLANAAQILGGAVLRARRYLLGQSRIRPVRAYFLRDLISNMIQSAFRSSRRLSGKSR